jgi:succinyl-CoA synthetase alpha subunit
VSIGGDRVAGASSIDHRRPVERRLKVKYLLRLGEVGSQDEYAVAAAVKAGENATPVIGWGIGAIAEHVYSRV